MHALKDLMLRRPSLKLAVGESVTCGRLQAYIGRIPGASTFFLGGITAYTIEQKVRHLDVDRTHAESVNAVSPQVAEEMARGAAALFGADIGLSTTGYAEPAPNFEVDTPFAWWGLAWRDGNAWGLRHGRVDARGLDRNGVQNRVAATAMGALLDFLHSLRGTNTETKSAKV